MPTGYNKGDSYEEKILQICVLKGITSNKFKRGGAGSSSDIEFIHKGKIYKLEVKADTKADFGQKMLKWGNNEWKWCVDDESTQMYTALSILELLQRKRMTPKRYTIPIHNLTAEDRQYDQRMFEQSIEIDTSKLFTFYKIKNCHYMQIGNFGFYYLDQDILNLGVPRFDGKLKLRFRAKTIHSFPIWNYGFYAVLKVTEPPTPSKFDIEENSRSFPPIQP